MKLSRWLAAIVLLYACSVFGVSTKTFEDSQSTDFKSGKCENVVISNMGKISLGAEISKLLENRSDVSTVFDVRILPNGSLAAATGPEGLLLVYQNKKWEKFFKSDQPYIFSIEISQDGKIYAGTGGTVGKVLEISADGKNSKVLFENKKIQYIWNLKRMPEDKILASTGPTGKLFLIDKSGGKEIFSCKQKNLQAMAVDKDLVIYIGTDEGGIVYKIHQQEGKYVSRALYDAKEEEISSLAIDEDGNLYAATASKNTASDQARSYLTKPQGTPSVTTTRATTKPAVTATAPAKRAAPIRKRADIPATQAAAKSIQQTQPSAGMIPMSPPSAGGNAVYRIDQFGFVGQVFRDQVNINSMIIEKGILYLGTGPDGYIFAVNPATEEITLYAKSGAGFVNSVRLSGDKGIVLATGNPGQVIKLGPKLAGRGKFTSKVFDAGQISQWGTINVTCEFKGALSVQTRTSIIADPEDQG